MRNQRELNAKELLARDAKLYRKWAAVCACAIVVLLGLIFGPIVLRSGSLKSEDVLTVYHDGIVQYQKRCYYFNYLALKSLVVGEIRASQQETESYKCPARFEAAAAEGR